MIKKGQKIRIKDNLVSELLKLGFEKDSAESMKLFENTQQIANDVYEDDRVTYITVDLCCEIPIVCCETINH